MSEHVFSYHKSKVDGEHWFSSIPYKATEIEKILDTEGGDNERQPTSIPSPFARIDLVGTSLLNLSKTANLLAEARIERSLRKYIATKNDERIVSALFDIGEILFNYDNFKERIKISVWNARFRDKNVEGTLSTLTGSELYGLRELGETIKLFLTSASDRKAYNFRDNNTFYIIKFDGKIIGGTSPSTFFFPSSNESQLKELDIDLGTHKAFKEIVPLYNRDLEYQKVWYALLEKNNTYKQNFLNGGFDQYIQKSAKIQEKKGIYTDRFRDSLPDYWTQKDDQNQQEGNNRENHFIIAGTDKVEVLGIRIIKRFVGDKIVPIKSDFKIQAKPTYKGALPLALSFSNHGDLTIKDTTTWENKGYTKDSIPYYDERRINDRTIPGFPDRYPCIYVTDLLEDYLVRVNYPINNQFFNSSSNTSNKGFLLPLKKEFFEYFSIDDIRKEKVRIKIEPPSPTGTVKVQLDIPISVRGNFTRYINFEKNYFNQKDALPDKKINKGILIESRFSLSIYPFIKFPTDITPDYRIQVMEMGNTSVDLKFESETSSDSGEITFRNTNKSVITASSKYIQLQNSFEYISVVANNEYNGIIIPELITPQPGNATFNFAIDFGTTNTHIEYSKSGQPGTSAFDTSGMVATLFQSQNVQDGDYENIFNFEFVPFSVGKNNDLYGFPLRTSLVAKRDQGDDLVTLGNINIPFYYEKSPVNTSSDEIFTNLKWDKSGDGESSSNRRIEVFIEELILLIRNKVLFEGGNLNNTQIIWFYPISMSTNDKENYGSIWDKLIEKYFGKLVLQNVKSYTESIPPFYKFKVARNITTNASPVISMDIGGGTTDVVVYAQDKLKFISSFRFAANAIFGDAGKLDGASTNGFVQKYQPEIEDLLEKLIATSSNEGVKNRIKTIQKNNRDIIEAGRSEDIISFWFTLNQRDINYSLAEQLLKDKRMKIVFLLFYGASMYHIAKLMKSNNIVIPTNPPLDITFSGTGSKILDIIGTSQSKHVQQLAEKIFSKVYGRPDNQPVEITIHRELIYPKQVTCQGALVMLKEKIVPEEKKIVYHNEDFIYYLEGTRAAPLSEKKALRYENLSKPETMDMIADEIGLFFEFFKEFLEEYDYEDKFSIHYTVFNLIDSNLRSLKTDIDFDINEKLHNRTDNPNKPLEETLFFYGLKGQINKLAYSLLQSK